MMTPLDPRWSEFIDRMEGPDGCNFRDDRFTCDNTPNRPLARSILRRMGLTGPEIEQSLGYFSAHGGMCDCEIIFNVKGSVDHVLGRDTRKPRRGPR